jgi:hypothetical protein
MGACALMSPFAPHLKQRNPAMTRSRGLSVSEVQLSLLASPSSRLRMDPLDSISGACRTRSGSYPVSVIPQQHPHLSTADYAPSCLAQSCRNRRHGDQKRGPDRDYRTDSMT